MYFVKATYINKQMTTQEVANRLVTLCREGKNMEAMKELYDTNITSLEMAGAPNPEVKGIEAVTEKSNQWYAMVDEFHGSEISEPIVAGNHFTCTMKMDVTFKDANRVQMEEVAVYTVNNGKITQEQFFYELPPQS